MRNQIITMHHRARKLVYGAAAASFIFYSRAALAVDTGLKATAEKASLPTGQTDLPTLVGKFISQLLGLVGVIFLVLMIYGGFLWMTAQGNEEQIKKAKSLITGAVIGIIIIFSAYAITYFVIQNVGESTGVVPGATGASGGTP